MNTDIDKMVKYLSDYDGEEIRIMEVCGTHTAGIFRSGLRNFLSAKIKLISGPGCPVCVTPTSFIDKCVDYAMTEGYHVVSFGDMLKVPGERYSLAQAKANGADISMVYSPFDIITVAKKNPDKKYVIAAVGFETTAPIFALLLQELIEKNLSNVRLLTSLKSTIPAIEWVCQNEQSIEGFLCPGHVSVITGADVYTGLCEKYGKSFVIAGFEEKHILEAVYETVKSVINTKQGGNPVVKNMYEEAVSPEGNLKAQAITEEYFDIQSAYWRGLGEISGSGFYIKEEFQDFDMGSRGLKQDSILLPEGCRCEDVITGRSDPSECSLFGNACTPVSPYGPCMVSAEGACGIWYQNRG